MKKVLFIALLLPVLAVAQFSVSGGGSLDLDEMLPIIADSAKWTDGSTVNSIKPRDAKTVEADSGKFGALEVTGNTRLGGNLTMVTTATEQVKLGTGSDAAPELSSAGDTDTGIRFTGSNITTFVQGASEKMRLGADGSLTTYLAGTYSNGGRRTYFGPDTLALFSGAKTGRDSTMYVMPDGSVYSTGKLVAEDSIRTNGTSKLIGNVQVGTGTSWFTAADSLLAIEGEISLNGFKVSAIDTVFTATYVPRWVKYTSGSKSWYSPVYADTTGKW